MNIYFSQIYIQEGVTFPFSHIFQKFLSEKITRLVASSDYFNKNYGADWDIIFRISAKNEIDDVEIKGPTTFKKDNDVEFTIFLPFQKLNTQSDNYKLTIKTIINSTCDTLDSLDISTFKIDEYSNQLVSEICENNEMFDEKTSA